MPQLIDLENVPWAKLLIPMMNDPVKSIYTPATHNEAVAILRSNNISGDLDEMVRSISGGSSDVYSTYVMEKAKSLRGKDS